MWYILIEGDEGMYTVFFIHGHVSNIKPKPDGRYYDNRDIIYDAVDIVSDGKRYNLDDIQSILSIPTPKYKITMFNSAVAEELGVTGCLDYVLRMKSSQHLKRKNYSLAIACLEKATKIMPFSSIGWNKNDYYRIAYLLEELGRFSEAEEWEQWIDANVPSLDEVVFNKVIEEAKMLKTDLVYTSWNSVASAVESKYQGRVYSISGRDKSFPSLPDFMKRPQSICPLAGAYQFWNDKELDTIFYKNKDIHVFNASWRQFKDDRTKQDINNYIEFVKAQEKKEEAEIARKVYYRLKYLIPDDVPKSISAFSRIKNQDSDKYKKLVEKAKEAGFIFPEMRVRILEPEDPEPEYNGGHEMPKFKIR